MTKKIKIDWFLALRFICSILVIRQHVEFPIPNVYFYDNNIGWILGGSNSSGSQAVVFFFCLSGYLMAKIFLSGKYMLDKNGVFEFWFNRLKRILPIYYFVCLISLVFSFRYILEPHKYNIERLIKIFTLSYDGSFPFNQSIWTIGIEVLFYILCPFLFFFYKKIINSKVWSGIIFISSVIILKNGLRIETSISVINSFIEFLPIFLVGSSTYLLVHHYQKKITNNIFPITTVTALLVILSLFFPWGNVGDKIPVTFFTVLFILTKELYDPEYKPQKNIINYLGVISLGIYLWHIPLLIQVKSKLFSILISIFASNIIAYYLVWLITILLSILVSHITYKLIELPCAKWLDNRRKHIL
jgi:peptidoglycan/LPS O-acetylase OafA/YrhL